MSGNETRSHNPPTESHSTIVSPNSANDELRLRNQSQMVHVLVIEDSELQVRLIQEMLADAGDSRFDVTIANDLHAGLMRLSNCNYETVLLDLTLPDSSGIDSCQRVRDAAPAVPIVVLTGVDDEEFAVSTLQHGAQDYLVKSEIDSRLLARAIRYAIERKRSELALQEARDELELRVEQRTAELKQMQEEAALRQEELAHASRLNTLGEMASGLAHELNQPLMAIIGFTDHCLHMLQSNWTNAERCIETLEDAGKEAKRAGEIIKRMRRLVSKRPAQHSPTDLNETVVESVAVLRPGLDVEIALALDDSLPKCMIDRVQVQQVILNLARNAVQAMKHGNSDQCKLNLRTGRATIDNKLFVEVTDNGPGLPQEDMERLFDPFFSRKEDGLGLGLSISRTIVESHGGKLTVDKNKDFGLTFRFTLPIASN